MTDTTTEEATQAAVDLLAQLPEDERSEIARRISPAEKAMTPDEARELLVTDPRKFHALADAQDAGGPRVLPEQLSSTEGMTPEQITEALKDGRLTDYLGRKR